MTPFLGCWSTSTSDECAAFNEIFFTTGDPTPAWAALYEDASCAGVQTAVADVGYFQGCCNEEAQTMIDCTVANADPRNTWGLTTPWEGLECPSIEIVPHAKPAKPSLIEDGSLIDTLTSMSGSDGVDEDSTDFDLLLHFLEVAGLTDALAEASDVTLFAPDDQAFCELSQIFGFNSTLGFTSCADEEAQIIFWEQAISTFPVEEEGQDGIVEGWKYILSYHVAQGAMTRKDLLGAGTITMMGGHEVTVRKGGGDRVVLVSGWTPPRPLPRVKTMQKNIKANTNFIQVITFPLTPPAPAWAPDAW